MIQQQQHYYNQSHQIESGLGPTPTPTQTQTTTEKSILSIRNTSDLANSVGGDSAYFVATRTQSEKVELPLDNVVDVAKGKQHVLGNANKRKSGSVTAGNGAEESLSGDENDSFRVVDASHYQGFGQNGLVKTGQFGAYSGDMAPNPGQIYPWMKDSRHGHQMVSFGNAMESTGLVVSNNNGNGGLSPRNGNKCGVSFGIHVGVSSSDLGNSTSHSIGSVSSPGNSDSLLATPTTAGSKSTSNRDSSFFRWI